MEQDKNKSNHFVNSRTESPSYDYMTYPKQFITYKWFKPILVAVIMIVITTIFSIILFAIARIWSGDPNIIQSFRGGYDSINFADGPYVLAMQGGIASVLIALAVAAIIVKDRPFTSYASSRGGWNWSAFLKCLALVFPVYILLGVINYVISPPATIEWRFTLSGFILTLVLTPLQCVAEEFIFRGFLGQTVSSWTNKPIIGIVVSALLFTAAHPYNILGVVEVLLCGLLLGFVAWKTRGIEATGAIHVLNNMLSFLMAGMGLSPITSNVNAISSIMGIVAYIISTALMIFVADKKFGWFTSQGDDVIAYNSKMMEKQSGK